MFVELLRRCLVYSKCLKGIFLSQFNHVRCIITSMSCIFKTLGFDYLTMFGESGEITVKKKKEVPVTHYYEPTMKLMPRHPFRQRIQQRCKSNKTCMRREGCDD